MIKLLDGSSLKMITTVQSATCDLRPLPSERSFIFTQYREAMQLLGIPEADIESSWNQVFDKYVFFGVVSAVLNFDKILRFR